MSKILADLTSKPYAKFHLGHTHLVRDDGGLNETQPGAPVGAKIRGKRMPSPRWNKLSFPERVATSHELEVHASSPRQHRVQPPNVRNARRMYSPQDQRGVTTVFVIMTRYQGQDQVLARVRGTALHCEVEAEKLARSQGCELADLKVVFQGELE